MLRDSELEEYLAEAEQFLNERTLGDIVGNCFYPAALKAAIARDSLSSLLRSAETHEAWKVLSYPDFLTKWQEYCCLVRSKMLQQKADTAQCAPAENMSPFTMSSL